jgi:hypothetical protein
LVSAINLIPILLGAQIVLLLSRGTVCYRRCHALHRWIAGFSALEGLIHIIVAWLVKSPDLLHQRDAVSIASVVAFPFVFLLGIAPPRFYELFLRLHVMLTWAIVVVLYLHNPGRLLASSAVCLTIVIGLEVAVLLVMGGFSASKCLSELGCI